MPMVYWKATQKSLAAHREVFQFFLTKPRRRGKILTDPGKQGNKNKWWECIKASSRKRWQKETQCHGRVQGTQEVLKVRFSPGEYHWSDALKPDSDPALEPPFWSSELCCSCRSFSPPPRCYVGAPREGSRDKIYWNQGRSTYGQGKGEVLKWGSAGVDGEVNARVASAIGSESLYNDRSKSGLPLVTCLLMSKWGHVCSSLDYCLSP